MTGLSFLHDNQSYDYIAADDDGHVTIVQTKLGIDPGPGAVLALQAQALMYSQALESARSWMRSQLLLDEVEEGVISLGPPAGRSALDDPAEWDEADEEPRWLAITDLPFRGGGVMSRHRPHR